MEQSSTPKKWYNNGLTVFLLLLFFFPVGLYGLWRSSAYSRTSKIVLTFFVLASLMLYCDNIRKASREIRQSNTLTTPNEAPANSTLTTTDAAATNSDPEREKVIEKLKARAKRDWPDDYTTQEYWINQQLDDYAYMLTIEDNSIKRKAQRDWPLDFSTQRYWYNEQIEAKERLK